jgi:hypothetical protein
MGTLTVSNSARSKAGNKYRTTGTLAFGGTYSASGETLYAADVGLERFEAFEVKGAELGYVFDPVIATGGASLKLWVYNAGGGTIVAEAAHTHAVALDSGASAAGASHTHGVTGLSNANESTHTHAAGAFTGTAITPDTFTMKHDATPETSALYVATQDGVHGYFNADNSVDNASDYFTTAGGAKGYVLDNNGSVVGFTVWYNVAAAAGQRLCCVNSITASDLYVPLSNGTTLKILHDAGAAGYKQVFFDDDGADKSLNLNANLAGAVNVTDNSISTSVKAHGDVAAGAVATSAAGSAHTHTFSGTIDAEATHTHASGTLADAASGVGSSHTHTFTGGASAEVTAGTNITALSAVDFEAIGV